MQIGIGVIGSSGVIGQKHVSEVQSLPNTKLVAIHDINTHSLKQQSLELGVQYYQNLTELLENQEVEAITIATPHPLHLSVALEAFKHGKHVLTEKPITSTLSEADLMVSSAKKAGVKLGVIYQNRLRKDLKKIHEMIEDGELGDIYRTSLDASSFRSQAYYDSGGWRGTWEGEGGGVLLNQGIHYIDMFMWLAGMPKKITGHVSSLMHNIEVEDAASALFEYENGAHGYLHCNTVQPPSMTKIELWGEKSGIVITDTNITLYKPEIGLREFSEREQSNPFAKPDITIKKLGSATNKKGLDQIDIEQADHKDAISDFAEAVIDDREPAATGEEGVKGLEIATSIIFSGCTNKTVELPPDRAAYDDLLNQLKSGRLLGRNP